MVRLLASRNVCGASADANASACTALLSSMPHRLAVDVLPTNHPPTFAMPEYLGAVEGAGPQAVRGFVHAISTGSAAAHEAGQRVHFAVSGQDDEGVAFVEAPRVDPDGTLRFAVAPGAHGVASLAVVASDDGGLDPRSFNASSAPRPLLLKVFPRPVVSAVVPRVGPASGGGPPHRARRAFRLQVLARLRAGRARLRVRRPLGAGRRRAVRAPRARVGPRGALRRAARARRGRGVGQHLRRRAHALRRAA